MLRDVTGEALQVQTLALEDVAVVLAISLRRGVVVLVQVDQHRHLL